MAFSPEEREIIKKMYSLDRGSRRHDKYFLEADVKSLEDFLDDTNDLEQRNDLLIRWLNRKTKESRRRCRFLIKSLIKSDKDNATHFKPAYEREIIDSVAKIFQKPYNVINQKELHTFAANFANRIYLFKNHLPRTLAYVLIGVMQHNNMDRADKDVSSGSLTLANHRGPQTIRDRS